MPNEEHCSCGCDHNHNFPQLTETPTTSVELTKNQKDFLHQLSHSHYLPIARFTVKDSREEGFVSTALAPVFLRSAADDMNTVKEAGTFLQKLENMSLITLDYDIPLNGYGYEEYNTSSLYEYFCVTVTEGATRPNFLGDTPVLELGSIALTEAGKKIADAHCDHHHHM